MFYSKTNTKINLTAGTGVGPTALSAFDSALVNAGVANFNLIYLSSVLPPGCDVINHDGPFKPAGTWGDRLYVVIAQRRTSLRNQEAWAGIGWMQDLNTKKGLLVEHDGHTEAEVKADIENSLKGLAANRGEVYGPIQMKITGKMCISLPVCALVIAVFQSDSWRV
jgi:arginine decarboxylase